MNDIIEKAVRKARFPLPAPRRGGRSVCWYLPLRSSPTASQVIIHHLADAPTRELPPHVSRFRCSCEEPFRCPPATRSMVPPNASIRIHLQRALYIASAALPLKTCHARGRRSPSKQQRIRTPKTQLNLQTHGEPSRPAVVKIFHDDMCCFMRIVSDAK